MVIPHPKPADLAEKMGFLSRYPQPVEKPV
jgi:hypothetical protein